MINATWGRKRRTEKNYSIGVRMSISLGEKGKGRNQVVKMRVVFGEEETP